MHPAVEAALVESHREFLGFLVRRLGDRDTAEDVLQEFYLRVVNRGSELRQAESVVAWLYTVLRTTLVDHYRREAARRRRDADFALMQTLAEDRWDVEPEGWVCACLNKVLPTLKPQYSDLLQRVDLLGAPPRKAAGDPGITANTMRVRLHRARRALRRALFQSCRNCPEPDCRICEQVRRQNAAFSEEHRSIAV
jgi:RNA polymerase sigma-70 factor (ECF subfamily)